MRKKNPCSLLKWTVKIVNAPNSDCNGRSNCLAKKKKKNVLKLTSPTI